MNRPAVAAYDFFHDPEPKLPVSLRFVALEGIEERPRVDSGIPGPLSAIVIMALDRRMATRK
jgi:hypothetical protein